MRIANLTFDGTPEEFQSVAHLFEKASHTSYERVPDTRPKSPSQSDSTIPGATLFERDIEGRTVDDYELILSRLPIPAPQQSVYKALYEAGDKGLTASEIQDLTGIEKAAFSNVTGQLGRRVNSTPGIGQTKKPGICLLFKVYKLNNGAGEWYYVMRKMLRDVLKTLDPSWLR